MNEEKDKKDIDLNKSEPDKSATTNKEEDSKTPSNITWTLNINKRTNLVYKVDIISARKSS